MKVVVIGGTGHVGTYLVPRLVVAGHDVVCVSRNKRKPYSPSRAWADVKMIQADRAAAEADGSFGGLIAKQKGDVVIDMICFTRKSGEQLVEGIRGATRHLIVCGTIWIHGPSVQLPMREEESRNPYGEYGVNKLKLTDYLIGESRTGGLPATVLHPGHIVGPGWNPVNPQANFNPSVFSKLAHGEELRYPTLGMETVHHVHADDVAQIFERALNNWATAVGEEFHVVSEAAVTVRGYAEAVARWFGKKPNLKFMLPDGEWNKGLSDDDVRATFDHIGRSPNSSIEKAKKLLGYAPRYTSFQAVHEALGWLIDHGEVDAKLPL